MRYYLYGLNELTRPLCRFVLAYTTTQSRTADVQVVQVGGKSILRYDYAQF
jgi:hypothetical protein